MLTVGIVSSCALTRRLLQAFLSSTGEFQIPVVVPEVLGNLESLKKCSLDVIIFDSSEPNEDLAILTQTKKLLPEIKIVMLIPREDHRLSLRAIEAGAHGCVSRDSDAEMLLKALCHVGSGEFWMKREVASMMAGKWVQSKGLRSFMSDELTRREWDILALLGQGSVNKDIAVRLSISENTVKTHLASIYRKMGVSTRLEAVLGYHHRLQKQRAEGVPPGPPERVAAPACEDPPCHQASLREFNPRVQVAYSSKQRDLQNLLKDFAGD